MYRDIGEYLSEHGEVLAAPLGGSMRPLLKGDKCQVLLVKPQGLLKKFDVVLYRGKAGKLVLHRLINVRDNTFVACGDNTYSFEPGICREQILGVMSGFYRKDSYVPVSDWRYQCYTKIWWFIFPLRKACWRIYRYIKGK
ncbi:S24/S26 family peptidase [Blautia schinkii]|nr:S24/S26 family peptidase [Blautia schinkii]